MATTPPGWYDDGRGALRWWDGAQWTEHVQTPDPEPEAPAGSPDEAMDTLLAPSIEPAVPAAPTLESARADAGGAAPVPSAQMPAADIYAPSAPPGYPGGFPGGPAPSGAFIAATEPKKSKLWVLWVVLGVVLIGIAVLATVLIPLAIGLFGTVANSGSSGAATGGDEASAIAVVELYDEAWRTVDCAKFEESTTEDFRGLLQYPDCESFTEAAQEFSDSVEGYEVTVVSVESGEDAFTIETRETFISLIDDEGNPTDDGVEYEELWTYTVVASEGGWVIGNAVAE